MTDAEAIAAEHGWTLMLTDDLWHVLDGGLPIGTGVTPDTAVRNVLDRCESGGRR